MVRSVTITLPQLVTLIDPGTATDRYHNEVADWSTATRVADVPFWIQERTSTSTVDQGRRAVTIDLIGFANPDLDIRRGMRVEAADGTLYEIETHPRRPSTPAGDHHIEVALRRVEG